MPQAPVAGIAAVSILRRRLLAWYDSNRRDLPWRRSADPYRVWLSEIMLQQTRVAAVLEHYRDFLTRFPSVGKLAAAPLESVLAAWSGLGYYRRARSLHRAARQIVDRHDGRLPPTLAELRALPGIGRYTAAAVASIAYGVPVAVVDGNVERVLSRLLAVAESLPNEPNAEKAAASMRDYWALAEALLQRRRPGDWNQAMMELGAMVCLPREPLCTQCPWQRWCKSATRSKSSAMPAPVAGTKNSKSLAIHAFAIAGADSAPQRRQHKEEAYLLTQRRGSVYLVRRDAEARVMAGMWELPRLGAPPAGWEPRFRLKHSITVTDYEVAIFDPGKSGEDAMGKPGGGRWVARERLSEWPLTGLARKVLRRARLIE